jgi:hypothetical protein
MYLQARAVSTDGLKPSFYTINIVVYVVQVKILVIVSGSLFYIFFLDHGCWTQLFHICLIYVENRIDTCISISKHLDNII